ncbi:MAG: hypothetical protein MUE30_08735 [Spirosomaceae bacterium]|jgi:predicted ABC-type ATPase|nr:hypothetical protein [Spirosomataceae bacterium]
MNPPILYVLAGPNEIGKTTSFFNQFPINLSTINADEIAKQLREKLGQVNVQEIANGEATRQMNLYISQKESFGFETNLADLDTWRFLQNLQIIGYQICINFFSTDEVELCVERVKNRVKEGGHFVREDIIRGRYEASLKLLNHFKNIPNILVLTDNSFIPKKHLMLEKGEVRFLKEPLPEWVKQVLGDEVITPKLTDLSIYEIRQKYQALKRDKDQ